MKTLLEKLIGACLISVLFLACKKDGSTPGSTNSPGSGNANAHIIQGTIYDANGNKFHIANSVVSVHIWGPDDIGHGDRSYNMSMDANSHYEQKVADGIYAFRASAMMPLNGQMVNIDLESTDGISPSVQQASAPGIIKDFRLRLDGLMKDGDPND